MITSWKRTFSYDHLVREALTLEMVATLTRRADSPKGMDAYALRITNPYDNVIETEYRLGVGHRLKSLHHKNTRLFTYRLTQYDWERSVCTCPDFRDVLHSLGSDYLTAVELPRTDPDALDYLAAELGMNQKPGEALRTVHALRKGADRWEAFWRGTGVDAQQAAEWAADH